MLAPDGATALAACLARISAAEAERAAALLREAKVAEQGRILSILARQSAEALVFVARKL